MVQTNSADIALVERDYCKNVGKMEPYCCVDVLITHIDNYQES